MSTGQSRNIISAAEAVWFNKDLRGVILGQLRGIRVRELKQVHLLTARWHASPSAAGFRPLSPVEAAWALVAGEVDLWRRHRAPYVPALKYALKGDNGLAIVKEVYEYCDEKEVRAKHLWLAARKSMAILKYLWGKYDWSRDGGWTVDLSGVPDEAKPLTNGSNDSSPTSDRCLPLVIRGLVMRGLVTCRQVASSGPPDIFIDYCIGGAISSGSMAIIREMEAAWPDWRIHLMGISSIPRIREDAGDEEYHLWIRQQFDPRSRENSDIIRMNIGYFLDDIEYPYHLLRIALKDRRSSDVGLLSLLHRVPEDRPLSDLSYHLYLVDRANLYLIKELHRRGAQTAGLYGSITLPLMVKIIGPPAIFDWWFSVHSDHLLALLGRLIPSGVIRMSLSLAARFIDRLQEAVIPLLMTRPGPYIEFISSTKKDQLLIGRYPWSTIKALFDTVPDDSLAMAVSPWAPIFASIEEFGLARSLMAYLSDRINYKYTDLERWISESTNVGTHWFLNTFPLHIDPESFGCLGYVRYRQLSEATLWKIHELCDPEYDKETIEALLTMGHTRFITRVGQLQAAATRGQREEDEVDFPHLLARSQPYSSPGDSRSPF